MAPKRTPAATLTLAQARAAWATFGGLGDPSDDPSVGAAGWLRTLGGVDAYLGLRARATGVTKAAIDAAHDRGDLKITPAVRGCIYLCPRRDAGNALRFSGDLVARRTARDREKAGIDPAELPPLADAVVALLTEAGPLSTDKVRRSLPEGSIRSLGAPGKKVGISSTLPPALRDAEMDGRIERVTAGGVLDTERYLWRIPAGRPAVLDALPTPEERRQAVLTRVLRAGGPTTLSELAEYTGAGKRDLAAALAALGAITVQIEGRTDEAWLLPDDLERATRSDVGDRLSLLAFEDLFTVLHGGPPAVTDPEHHGILIRAWGRGRPSTIGESKHLASRSIVRGGTLIGVWEFDAARQTAQWAPFGDEPASERKRITAAVEETGAWLFANLGHGRTFNMDGDDKVQRRADALRSQGISGAAVS